MAKRKTSGVGTSRGSEAVANHAKKVKEAARRLGAEGLADDYADLEKRMRAAAEALRRKGK